MTTREILVGRDTRCDICLGLNCVYASNMHAKIYMDGNQLVYRDISRNGTMINNVNIHQRAIYIHYGDTIMIAGRYPLGWNSITRYFPVHSPQPAYNPQPENYGTAMVSSANNTNAITGEKPNFGWNWGAFSLYPLWGFWNGCWWAILIGFFFGWCIIPNILFGAMGSKWAWNNKEWGSVEDFNEMQSAWKPWGIAIFILDILTTAVILIFYYALLVSFWAMLAAV